MRSQEEREEFELQADPVGAPECKFVLRVRPDLRGRNWAFLALDQSASPQTLLAPGFRQSFTCRRAVLQSEWLVWAFTKESTQKPGEEVKGTRAGALTVSAAGHPIPCSDLLIFYIQFTSSQLLRD